MSKDGFNLGIALLLVVIFAIENVVYVKYFQAVEANQPIRASVYSVSIYVISIFGVISYINNYWYVIPVLLGAIIGTYGGVRWKIK